MPEHTPAPTPHRSIYGFVMYLSFKTMFVIYLCWAIIPDRWLHAMDISYYPQKYWAVAIPIQLLVALTLFAFFIYPGLNLAMTPSVDDIRTLRDNFSIKRDKHEAEYTIGDQCDCKNKDNCYLNEVNAWDDLNDSLCEPKIAPVEDLDLSDVCRTLYL